LRFHGRIEAQKQIIMNVDFSLGNGDTSPDGVPPTPPPERSEISQRVLAVIRRRAHLVGMTDEKYFREIIALRARQITRAEAAREPLLRAR
jgi:hypothetical protein